jgi:hypothetical protein
MDLNEDKVLFGIGTSIVMVGAWALTAALPALAPNLTVIVGGLTGVFAIFAGSHVTAAYVQTKAVPLNDDAK